MNVNKVFKVECLSKDDLIVWFRKNISNKLHTIEQLGNGGDFLLAIEMIMPGNVALQKVKFQKTTESDRLRNFQTLRKIFHKFGIDKDIEAEKMVKGLFKENYHFALWFRSFFRANYKSNDRIPLDSFNALRQRQQTMSTAVAEGQGENITNKEDLPDINPNGKMNDSTTLSRNPKELEKEFPPSLPTGTFTKDNHFENKKLREVNRYCSVKNTSKQDLINWFRSTLSPTLHSIEELGSGVDYCLGLEVLFPGLVPMHHVRFNKATEGERISNFRVIGRVLDELGVEKDISLERLAKGIFKDNLQFAQWFKAFFLSNYRGQAYDIGEIRAAKRKKSKTRPELPNDPTIRISTKGVALDNIGQGDAFEKMTNKMELGLPGVGNHLSQSSKVDVASQTDQPLPSMSNGQMLSAGDSDNRNKLFKIRLSCEQYPENELSEIIIRLLDEDDEDGIEDEEEEMEEGLFYEGLEMYGMREEESRHHGGQLLPTLGITLPDDDSF